MRFFSFTLEKPVLYYMGGEFRVSESWKHRKLYHKGDYELIFCIKGPMYMQIGSEQFVLKPHQVLRSVNKAIGERIKIITAPTK